MRTEAAQSAEAEPLESEWGDSSERRLEASESSPGDTREGPRRGQRSRDGCATGGQARLGGGIEHDPGGSDWAILLILCH